MGWDVSWRPEPYKPAVSLVVSVVGQANWRFLFGLLVLACLVCGYSLLQVGAVAASCCLARTTGDVAASCWRNVVASV